VINVIEKLSTRVTLFILSCVAIAVNFPLLKMGPALLDADNYIYPLTAERLIRFGEWKVFPFNQTYGGNAYTWVRAGWVKLFTLFFGEASFISAHMSFSFIVSPLIIAIFSYFMLRAYCSKSASFFVGLVAAVGFQYWSNMAGMDIYLLLPIIGALFLIIRRPYENPFFEMSLAKIGIIGVACGFLVYTFQPTLLFIVAFFAPWNFLTKEFNRLRFPTNKADKVFRDILLFLVGLFFYLLTFGEKIGTLAGHPIQLKAAPNLKLAILLFFVFVLLNHAKNLKNPNYIRRALILSVGFILGFLPEVFFWIHRHGIPAAWHNQGGANSLQILIPRYTELILGRTDSVPYTGILRNFPLVFFSLGLISLSFAAKKDQKWMPAVAIIILNVVAFFNISMTAPGATKYLIPVYPPLLLGAAIFFDQLKSRRLQIIGLLLVFLTCSYQISQKWTWASAQNQVRINELEKISQAAAKMGVSFVWTDDFWQSLQYSFFTQEKPIFGSVLIPWESPPDHWITPRSEDTVGVLLTGTMAPDSSNQIKLMGRTYDLTLILKENNLSLFKAVLTR
jgi:hypothetical protein